MPMVRKGRRHSGERRRKGVEKWFTMHSVVFWGIGLSGARSHVCSGRGCGSLG